MIVVVLSSLAWALVVEAGAIMPAAQPEAAGRMSISVLDAQSKQPIREFRVLPGTLPNAALRVGAQKTDGEQPVYWQPHLILEGHDGALLWPAQRGYAEMALRVEADGYRTRWTQKLRRAELPGELDILEADVGLRGWVLRPDGRPAGGALLAFAIPGRNIMLRDGKIYSVDTPIPDNPSDRWRRTPFVKADAAGRFECPDESDPFGVVLVYHNAGVAEMPLADLRKQPKVTLKPWGKIVGQVRSQGTPRKNIEINLAASRRYFEISNLIEQYADKRADDKGQFAFEKVLPGQAQISETTPGLQNTSFDDDGIISMIMGMNTMVDVASGKPTVALLGGQGRTVRGRFTGRDDWSGVTFHVHPNAPHVGLPGDDELWRAFGEWKNSEVGPLYFRDGLKPNADGTFEIASLLPGTYQLFVSALGVENYAAFGSFTIAAEKPGEAPSPLALPPIAVKTQ